MSSGRAATSASAAALTKATVHAIFEIYQKWDINQFKSFGCFAFVLILVGKIMESLDFVNGESGTIGEHRGVVSMAEDEPQPDLKPAASKKKKSKSKPDPRQSAQREIPGNLPYTTSAGTFKKVLEKIVTAERPTKVNYDYLDTVLGFSGGSARQALSLLRRLGLVGPDGSPTEIYAKFKTDSGRSSAALSALRAGFAEIFKRNEHAHRANDQKLTDIIVEITGLPKNDGVARAIKATFVAVKSFVKDGEQHAEDIKKNTPVEEPASDARTQSGSGAHLERLGIAYNINVVLPETTNVDVFNAIFKSLRENLLQ